MCRNELLHDDNADSAVKVGECFRDLLEQDVLVFRMHIREADFSKALYNQNVKLKCRLDGKMAWESHSHKVASERPRVVFNKDETFIYEGGQTLEFEICKQTIFGYSAIGRCAFPLTEALSPERGASVLKFIPTSATTAKCLGHLTLGFWAIKTSLKHTTGVEALMRHSSSVNSSDGKPFEDHDELKAYASKTKARLENVIASILGSDQGDKERVHGSLKRIQFSLPHVHFYEDSEEKSCCAFAQAARKTRHDEDDGCIAQCESEVPAARCEALNTHSPIVQGASRIAHL